MIGRHVMIQMDTAIEQMMRLQANLKSSTMGHHTQISVKRILLATMSIDLK